MQENRSPAGILRQPVSWQSMMKQVALIFTHNMTRVLCLLFTSLLDPAVGCGIAIWTSFNNHFDVLWNLIIVITPLVIYCDNTLTSCASSQQLWTRERLNFLWPLIAASLLYSTWVILGVFMVELEPATPQVCRDPLCQLNHHYWVKKITALSWWPWLGHYILTPMSPVWWWHVKVVSH